jgi:hypothetical protein
MVSLLQMSLALAWSFFVVISETFANAKLKSKESERLLLTHP